MADSWRQRVTDLLEEGLELETVENEVFAAMSRNEKAEAARQCVHDYVWHRHRAKVRSVEAKERARGRRERAFDAVRKAEESRRSLQAATEAMQRALS